VLGVFWQGKFRDGAHNFSRSEGARPNEYRQGKKLPGRHGQGGRMGAAEPFATKRRKNHKIKVDISYGRGYDDFIVRFMVKYIAFLGVFVD
jgi:hypothetical protein